MASGSRAGDPGGRRRRGVPRARRHGLSARGPRAPRRVRAGEPRGARRARPQDRDGVPGDHRVHRSQRRRAAQRAPPCCATARSSPATTRCSCRTSASSTSSATSCPAPGGARVEVGGLTTGLSVCEDAWHDAQPFAGYAGLPLIVNINGSPYHRGKIAERADILAARARQTGAWIAYVNAVGGQDELVFDGGSMMVAPDGTVRQRGRRPSARTCSSSTCTATRRSPTRGRSGPRTTPRRSGRRLVLGLGDYVRKNGFDEAVLGLSGGHRLCAHGRRSPPMPSGADAVRGLAMPSPFSSAESVEDADRLRHAARHARSTRSRSPRCSTRTGTRSPSSSRARRRT